MLTFRLPPQMLSDQPFLPATVSCPVPVLVHGQLRRECHQQDDPEQFSVSGHRVSVPHPLNLRLHAAADPRLEHPAGGRAAAALLPPPGAAARLRQILRLGDGPHQHLESTRVVRAHS